MRNKILLLVLVSLMILPNLSLAESTASSTKNKETEAKEIKTIKDKIDAQKESLKNAVEERKQNILGKMKEKIDKFVQNMLERFDAATNRLEKIADRINSRITKMEAKSVDVSKAKELLTTARTKIDIAKISAAGIASTTNIYSLSTTTEVIREDFKAVKTQIEKAKEDIKTAHAALVDVINNLKPGQNKEKVEN